jgi:hypothetical protein
MEVLRQGRVVFVALSTLIALSGAGVAPSQLLGQRPKLVGPAFTASHELYHVLTSDGKDVHERHDRQRLYSTEQAHEEDFQALGEIYTAETLQDVNDPASFTDGVPVAVVYASAAYSNGYLKFSRGYNCVWLKYAAPNAWTARVRPNGSETCPAFPSNALATDPKVYRWTFTKGSQANPVPPESIPSVARWDRDQRKVFIGVKCADGWCDIGPSEGNKTLPLQAGTRDEIKGWYDEQILAEDNGQGGLKNDYLSAKIVPTVQSGTLKLSQFEDWQQVATYYLDHYTKAYGRKLKVIPDKTNINVGYEIWLRHNDDLGPNDGWQAEIRSAVLGNSVAVSVKREGHETGAFHVPGTARWEWSENDETAWVRCAEGCCSVGDPPIIIKGRSHRTNKSSRKQE